MCEHIFNYLFLEFGMAASTTTASVIKITHCNLCKEVFMQQPNEKPSSRCNKCSKYKHK